MRDSTGSVVLPASPLFPANQLALLASLNETSTALSSDVLHSGFERHARMSPEALALISGELRLSYSQLRVLARGLSAQLRERGALRNTLVALVMEKGWEQVAGAVAVGMSGAAYLPLDAHWPQDRLDQLLKEGEVSVVLTQSRVLRHWKAPPGVQTICVDEQGWQPCSESELAAGAQWAQADDLAYVIYTSGSTGRPKA
jgi:pyochelin synthetase